MVRIFLTGYMGAGKTTLGKAFARKMNVPFVDLDWYIEERLLESCLPNVVKPDSGNWRGICSMRWPSSRMW